MNTHRTKIMALAALGFLLAGQLGEAAPQLRFRAEKANYIVGELIWLRLDVEGGPNGFAFQIPMFWGQRSNGEILESSKDKGPFHSLLGQVPFQVPRVPQHRQNWVDWSALPQTLEPNTTYSRIDPLVLEPGHYRVRAVLQTLTWRG